MGRGRKPAPRPIAGQPAPPAGGKLSVEPPDGMGRLSAAKWRAIVPIISAQIELKDADSDAIRQYCEAAVIREKAMAELEDQPLLDSGPNGARYMNPLLKVIRQCETIMAKLSERFGLDPASRRRLAIEASKADSPFMEFIKRGKPSAK